MVACNYSIISARVCNTAVHRRQQFSYDSSALSAQAGVHSIGTVPKTWFADAVDFLVVIRITANAVQATSAWAAAGEFWGGSAVTKLA